ncbi:MAG: sortase domain-containing protein [Acidimicrobiales bacterium]
MWWATALATLIVGLGLLIGAFVPVSNPRTEVLASTPTSPVTTQKPVVTLVRVASSAPRTLSIPSIGVTTSVGELGLLPNGQVMVPATTKTAGWFKYGPTPGQVGSSVILAHVDSYKGPGVFFYIRTLHPGAIVTVGLANGTKINFVVTKVVQYSKTGFPDKLVYGEFDKPGVRQLNLVTCGGAFDHATGSYLANIVVFTKFAGVAR